MNRWKRRKEAKKALGVMPEMMRRISADPDGTGEPVEWKVAQDIADKGVPLCAFERVSRDFGKCNGGYAMYQMPKKIESGFDVFTRACDFHGDALMVMGFIRLEDDDGPQAGPPAA